MIILMIICFIFFSIMYIIRKELLSPTFCVTMCFMVAFAFCTMFKNEWDLNLHSKMILIIIVGLLGCFLGEFFCLLIKKNSSKELEIKPLKEIKIEDYKIILFIILQLIVLFSFYKEVIRISGRSNVSFSVMMNSYKNAIYETSSIENNVNILIKQFAKISYAGTIICLGIFINNCLANGKIIKNIKYIIPLIIYILLTIIQSARSNMLQIIMSGIVMYYFLWRSKNNWKTQIDFKSLLKIVLIIFIMLLFFWMIKELVGRTSKKSFIEYIGFYFGGGVPLFNKYIEKPYGKFDGILGAETFTSIWGFVSKFSNYNIVGNLEFRHSGDIHGNTYTAFREYYHDFGILGVFILEFCFSTFYTILLLKLKKIVIEKDDDYILKTILISAFCYPLFYETIAAQLYRVVLSIGTLTYIFFIYIMYYVFVKLKIKIKKLY